MKAYWSDGSEFVLEPGQRWQDKSIPNSQDIVRIEKIEGDQVLYVFEALEHHQKALARQGAKQWERINGVDGFIDFLESNCYEIIPNDVNPSGQAGVGWAL